MAVVVDRPRRRLAAAAAALAVLVVAGGTTFALATADDDLPTLTSVEITIRHSRFVPDRIAVPVGVPVTITLVNTDPIDHEWIVGDEAVHAVHRVGTEPLHPSRPTEVVVPAGESRTTVVTFEAGGKLRFICHLPAHEAYGMVGEVVIR
ncbi:MAG TPA: cupredoxin domain-containing protein [Candidatus Binatia bacterium]|nr:cupredoxin domain-containing protein [Candidatus Binatia bacterium]